MRVKCQVPDQYTVRSTASELPGPPSVLCASVVALPVTQTSWRPRERLDRVTPSTGWPSWPAEAPGRRSSNTKAVCQTHHWNCEERGSGRQVRAEGLETRGGDLGV